MGDVPKATLAVVAAHAAMMPFSVAKATLAVVAAHAAKMPFSVAKATFATRQTGSRADAGQ